MPAALGEGLLKLRRTRVRVPPPPRVLRGNREGCWRCANTLITGQNGVRPRDCIADPDPRGLRRGPQFQVLRSIVVTNAVSLMHGLTFGQVAAEKFLGHEDVLEDLWISTSAGVTRQAHHHLAGFMTSTTALPVAIGLPLFTSTIRTGCRLHLLWTTAFADSSRSTRRATKMSARRPKDLLALAATPAPHKKYDSQEVEPDLPLPLVAGDGRPSEFLGHLSQSQGRRRGKGQRDRPGH